MTAFKHIPLLPCQFEVVGCEADIAVGVVLGDAGGVHVTVQELAHASLVVECRDGSDIISEVLKTSSRSKVVCLRRIILTNKNVIFLRSYAGKIHCNFD